MSKVLVADDNRDAADSLVAVLEVLGHTALGVYDGRQAVEAMATFQPDLVILDINMPVMDGYEAARTIRSARGERVILAAVTGAPQWETKAKASESGFDEHFTKPVDPGDLELLLGRVMSLGQARRGVPGHSQSGQQP